jgi:serine/threonine-protein kinase
MAGGGRTFRFGNCIGEGGFGEVYRAVMRSPAGLEREVAVKTLKAAVAPDVQAVRRLRDEARLLARLDHRAILSVHDLVRLDGRVALVSQLLQGEDLKNLLTSKATVPLRVIAEVMSEVAGALATASERLDLVHRDVKPSNIHIGRDGTVKLLDFGIARSPQVSREGHTGTGLVVGTFGYLAPERVSDEDHGPASDVYSLGCVLFAALAREPLYRDVSRSDSLRLSIDDQMHDEFIKNRLDTLPPSPLATLLPAMLSYERSVRPPARDLEVKLEDIAASLEGPTVRRWCRQRAWPELAHLPGALEGRDLVEEPLELEIPTVPDAAGTDQLTIDFTPMRTLTPKSSAPPTPRGRPQPAPAPAPPRPHPPPGPATELRPPPRAPVVDRQTDGERRSSSRRAARVAPRSRGGGSGCGSTLALWMLFTVMISGALIWAAEEGHLPGLKDQLDTVRAEIRDYQDRNR